MILIQAARVIDPASSTDRELDVLVEDGVVKRIGSGLRAPSGARVVDGRGKILAPGLVDLHVHLREPGQEYKEDIASGTRAAAAGGFTTVCCMPNTVPPNDCRAVTDLIVRRAREVGRARVRPVGAISKQLAGESLAEMAEMKDAGIVAVSDDGKPVMNAELMRRALEYARTFGLPVVQHAEDLNLSANGVMNEGPVATRAGLRGQPGAAESAMVARDLELVGWTGARYHVAHLSTRRSLDLVRAAKKQGLPVTCEVTPHHLSLTDDACAAYDTSTKVAPPLRTGDDLAALKEGLADGTVDAIATDHAPHSLVEKDLEFDHASFGMTGVETALPLVLKLVDEHVISLSRAIDLFTRSAARCFGLDAGRLAEGGVADLVLIDPARAFTVDRAAMLSKSKNTPFHGWALRGRAVLTLMSGAPTFDLDGVLA